jgi:DNA repair protein RadC
MWGLPSVAPFYHAGQGCARSSPPPRATGHRPGRALPRRERGARDRAKPNNPARCRKRAQRDFAFNMQVYEATIQYSLVRVGNDEPLNTPPKVVDYMAGAFDDAPMQESFYVICLNRKNRPLCRNRMTLGTASNVLIHPREVFRIAVLASATAIVCVHNHPSGDPSPSAADLAVTRQLREAAKTMDIHLMDHVIIGTKEDDPNGQGWYSFRGTGLI